jgi:hypothetical protein
MVMNAVTTFEMTVQINSKSLAGNNFVTIFCKMIVQTLVILLEVFNKDTSSRFSLRIFIVKHKNLIPSTSAVIPFAALDVGNP